MLEERGVDSLNKANGEYNYVTNEGRYPSDNYFTESALGIWNWFD